MAEVFLPYSVPDQKPGEDVEVGLVFDDASRQVVAVYGHNGTEDWIRFRFEALRRATELILPAGSSTRRRLNIPTAFRPTETRVTSVSGRTGETIEKDVIPFDRIVAERSFAVPRRGSPTVLGITTTIDQSFGSSMNVSYPAAVDVGDLLFLAVGVYDNNASGGAFSASGLTQIAAQDDGSAYLRQWWAAKNAVGDEDGGSVTVSVFGSHMKGVAHFVRIEAGTWDDSGTLADAIDVGSVAAARSTSVNPPPVSASWGADDNLWVPMATVENDITITAPTHYTANKTQGQAGGAGADLAVAISYRVLNASSEDVGAWTWTGTEFSMASTAVVKPGGAGEQSISGDAVFAPALSWPTGIVGLTVSGDGAFAAGLTWPVGSLDLIVTGDDAFSPALSWPQGTVVADQTVTGDAVFSPGLSWPQGDVGISLSGEAAFAAGLSWPQGSLGLTVTGDAAFTPGLSWPQGSLDLVVSGDAVFAPALSWPQGSVSQSLNLDGDDVFAPALVWSVGAVVPDQVTTGDAVFAPGLTWPQGSVLVAVKHPPGPGGVSGGSKPGRFKSDPHFGRVSSSS